MDVERLLNDLVSEAVRAEREDLDDPAWEPEPRWAAVLGRVPRHLFVDGFSVDAEPASNRRFQYIDPRADPERWMRLVYNNQPLVTRLDRSERPLSSSSAPSMMLRFLQLLEVFDGCKVLEIGTGTGYNAALLCERLGSACVTTIEIDPGLVDRARKALSSCGHRPRVAVADGHEGYAANSPYDRIVATAAVGRVPDPWMDQLGTDGIIVAPLGPPFTGGLVALRAQPDGTLLGRFHPRGAGFMELRRHVDRVADHGWSDLIRTVAYAEVDDLGACREVPVPTSMPPGYVVQLMERDLMLYHLSSGMIGVVSSRDRAWARFQRVADGDHAVVREGGPRRLWDVMTSITEEWQRLGEPHGDRFGMVVTRDRRQFVWLDSADGEHRWEL